MPQQEEEGRIMLRIRGPILRGKVPSSKCLTMEEVSRMAMGTGKEEMVRTGEHKPRS
jgi:hypothetical protein